MKRETAHKNDVFKKNTHVHVHKPLIEGECPFIHQPDGEGTILNYTLGLLYAE